MKLPALLTALLLPALVLPALAARPDTEPVNQRLTIQQNGQAHVTETRTLNMKKGTGTVILELCPPTLDAHTLEVRPLASGGGLKLLNITHEPPLSGPGALLRAHVGKTVTVIIKDAPTGGLPQGGTVRKEALVLSADDHAGAPLLLVDGQIYSGPVQAILYPGPAQPRLSLSAPRISLAYANTGPERQKIEASYLAGEISWRMDYSLTSDKDFTRGRLSGLVTISNRSGADFSRATVELLAGDPRSVTGGANKTMLRTMAMASLEDSAQASPEALFEYHLYKLAGTLNLPNQAQTQVPLLPPTTMAVSRRLVARAGAAPAGRMAEPMPQTAQALVSFRNIGSEGLGRPLPKGILRLYQEDASGRRFVGEAALDRVAVGGRAEVMVGQAFDLTLERTAKEYERTGRNSFRGAWEITVRNSKAEKQKLYVQESFPGAWRITESSHKFTRVSARVAEFELDVPPTGDGRPLTLTYSFTLEQ